MEKWFLSFASLVKLIEKAQKIEKENSVYSEKRLMKGLSPNFA